MSEGLAFPPDPDEEEQVLIIAAVIEEWWGTFMESTDSDRRQDVVDCAGNISEALNNRRHALLEDLVAEAFPSFGPSTPYDPE